MLTISCIPNEIYLIAIDYEGWERPENPDDAADSYMADQRHYGITSNGLERAISDYLLRAGAFDCDNGEFADVDGWRHRA